MKRPIIFVCLIFYALSSFYSTVEVADGCDNLQILIKDQRDQFRRSIIRKTEERDEKLFSYLSRYQLFKDDTANIFVVEKELFFEETFLSHNQSRNILERIKACLLKDGRRWFFKELKEEGLLTSQFYIIEQNIVLSLQGDGKTGKYERLMIHPNDPNFDYIEKLKNEDSLRLYGFSLLK